MVRQKIKINQLGLIAKQFCRLLLNMRAVEYVDEFKACFNTSHLDCAVQEITILINRLRVAIVYA